MNNRKAKKLMTPGKLVTVKGTSCVFMCLGKKKGYEIESFNGFDLKTGMPVTRCDGAVRLATKTETIKYWHIIRLFVTAGGCKIPAKQRT